ncbi:MAG: hypothetical protein WDO73_10115 [Ignavibacteriota bacterium]
MGPACTEKLAVFIPAPMVTDGGAVSRPLPVERTRLTPPAGAAWLSVTVQVVEVDGASAVGLQAKEEMLIVDTRATVALAELPLYAALIVAL